MTMPAKRPNILLITTDQQRHDHLGVAGLRGIETPNLDRLATEGVRFKRAYCPSPICTPSRVSLLTGRYPSSHGAYSIGVTPDPFPTPTLPELLRKSGYRTALLGKPHFVRIADHSRHILGKDVPLESDEWAEFDGPYVGFDFVQVCIGHTTNASPNMHYRQFLERAGVDYSPWFPQTTDTFDHHWVGAWQIPRSITIRTGSRR